MNKSNSREPSERNGPITLVEALKGYWSELLAIDQMPLTFPTQVAAACEQITGVRPSRPTLHRWISRTSNPLRTGAIGRRRYSKVGWLKEFLEANTKRANAKLKIPPIPIASEVPTKSQAEKVLAKALNSKAANGRKQRTDRNAK